MSGGQQRLPVITNSQARCFRRCPREHFYSYLLGYRPLVDDDALYFGALIHLGLEAWWREASAEHRLERAIEALRGKARDDFDLVRAGVLLQGYDARWGNEPLEALAVEHESRSPLINPATGAASRTYEVGFKLDVIALDHRDQRTKLIEHKTSSQEIGAGSVYWRRLTLDPQISTYITGARSAGFMVSECLYDVIGKPQLRPGSVPLTDEQGIKIVLDAAGDRVRTKQGKWRETASSADGYVLQTRPETPDEFRARLADHVAANPDRYYQRGTVVRLEEEERDAAHDLWHTARLIREAQLSGRHVRNPDSCERFGRLCSFFDVCTGVASLDDATRFRRVDNVHEELSSEAA